MLKQVACVFAVVSLLAPEATFAASDVVNRVTVTSINLYTNYPGTFAAGALIFFTPAKPGMGECLNTAGNVAWISWEPIGEALFRIEYDNYRAGRTIGLATHGCTLVTATIPS